MNEVYMIFFFIFLIVLRFMHISFHLSISFRYFRLNSKLLETYIVTDMLKTTTDLIIESNMYFSTCF